MKIICTLFKIQLPKIYIFEKSQRKYLVNLVKIAGLWGDFFSFTIFQVSYDILNFKCFNYFFNESSNFAPEFIFLCDKFQTCFHTPLQPEVLRTSTYKAT